LTSASGLSPRGGSQFFLRLYRLPLQTSFERPSPWGSWQRSEQIANQRWSV